MSSRSYQQGEVSVVESVMDSSIPRAVGDPHDPDSDPLETREWIEALDALIQAEGSERATFLLRRLLQHARTRRVPLPQVLATPYVNTIPLAEDRKSVV